MKKIEILVYAKKVDFTRDGKQTSFMSFTKVNDLKKKDYITKVKFTQQCLEDGSFKLPKENGYYRIVIYYDEDDVQSYLSTTKVVENVKGYKSNTLWVRDGVEKFYRDTEFENKRKQERNQIILDEIEDYPF